jgi:hypothetical protein
MTYEYHTFYVIQADADNSGLLQRACRMKLSGTPHMVIMNVNIAWFKTAHRSCSP